MKSEMDWQQASAFVDGELDLSEQLAMELRIENDPALRAEIQSLRELRESIRDKAEYHSAPEFLRSALQVSSTRPAPLLESSVKRQANLQWPRWFDWRPFCLGLGLAALTAFAVNVVVRQSQNDALLAQEVVASHVRATLGQRLLDVASSDQHTVKPWLSSHLDFSPPVTDVALPGVNFLGGRVDYLSGHAVAALVYKQREHVINVYVWPTSQSDSVPDFTTQRGFNVGHWSNAGMAYRMVSDLNVDELAVLAKAVGHGKLTRQTSSP